MSEAIKAARLADALIAESRIRNAIVHAPYTPALHCQLVFACEDNVKNGSETEFWGRDWRIHLTGVP